MNDSDLQILRSFAASDTEVYKALVRVIEHKLTEVIDIRNIELDKNVGLQTYARRTALTMLEEFLRDLHLAGKPKEDKKLASSFR